MVFVPQWAKAELDSPSVAAELEVLREFFDCWEALHAIPHDKLHRKQLEQAAQRLTDAAQSVRSFRDVGKPKGTLTLNGVRQ